MPGYYIDSNEESKNKCAKCEKEYNLSEHFKNVCRKHVRKIKSLKEQIEDKDKRIQELEKNINKQVHLRTLDIQAKNNRLFSQACAMEKKIADLESEVKELKN